MLVRYGFAALALFVATALRLWLDPALGDYAPFVTYFGATFFTVLFFGLGPSLLALLMGALLAIWLFVPPQGFILPMRAPHWAALGLYLTINLAVIVLLHFYRRSKAAAETSERHFRRLLEAGNVGIALVDQRGGVSYANQALLNLIGYTADEVREGQLRWDRITPPEQAHVTQQVIRDIERSGAAALPYAPYEKEYIARDGHRIPVLISLVPFERLPDGTGIGAMFVTDLTKIKQAEKGLRESEAQFRKVIDLVPDILYRAEVPSYCAEFISPAVQPLLGFTPEEWKAEPTRWLQQLYEEDRARVTRESEAGLASADDYTLQYRLWHKDGRTWRWFEDRVHVERDQDRRPIAVFGAMNDITDRKRAEQAIHQREQEFRALADRSPDVVARLDRDLVFRYINPCVEKYAAERSDFFIGKALHELQLPEETESALTKRLRDVFTTEQERRLSIRYRGADRQDYFFDTRLVPEFETGGQVATVIAVSRDITALHRAERRLKLKARDLKKANKRLYAQTRHDVLTGLANRRYLFNFVESEWRRESRHDEPISLIIADIDQFKAYNDRYGHLAGDECLREVAEALRTQVHRPGDLLARYGGEEFVAVLPETPASGASRLAESMRRTVEELRITHESSSVAPHITISLGVAEVLPKRDSVEELIARADAALYRAKADGRNRTYTA